MAVKVGFIGAGGIARYHAEHLAKIKEARIVAFCDLSKERAEKMAREFGAGSYTDHHRMLEKEELDAVYICIPPFAHQDQEILAAEKGINIFVEKPIALTLKKAEQIEAKVLENKVITSVGYQQRYLDIADRLRLILKGKRAGAFFGYWMGTMPPVSWWRRKEESGGQIIEQTTHIFDMARYLFGEVEKVFAISRTGLMSEVKDYNVEDASSVSLYFKDGLIGTISSACFLSCGFKVGMDIYLKDMVIEYRWGRSLKIIEEKRTEKVLAGNDPGFLEDQVFIEAVRTADPSRIRSDYSDALKTLKLTLAADESLRTGKVVKV